MLHRRPDTALKKCTANRASSVLSFCSWKNTDTTRSEEGGDLHDFSQRVTGLAGVHPLILAGFFCFVWVFFFLLLTKSGTVEVFLSIGFASTAQDMVSQLGGIHHPQRKCKQHWKTSATCSGVMMTCRFSISWFLN